MRIAITADVHLTTEKEHPERYNALNNILDQMLVEKIDTIIIAGDLFDAESQNYSDFGEFCKQPPYREISFYIIPGNHDLSIKPGHFTASNITVFNEPEIIPLGDPAINFLFVPYLNNKPMGEVVAEHRIALANRWILIGHGDYICGLQKPNPYEPGIYMPLSRKDLEYYNPAIVVLGHIHKKINKGKVHYPGSPCGLDINETGKRTFLILDTNDLKIESKTIDTDNIFWNEALIALPTENEFDNMKKKIENMIQNWNLKKTEIQKVKVRLKIKGYTSNIILLSEIINETLRDFTFYDDEGPNLTEVSIFNDPELIRVVDKVRGEIEKLEWDDEITTKDDILEQALHVILKE